MSPRRLTVDLEHGPQGLRELLEGGYRLVASNIRFAETDLQRQIAPAYAADLGAWRVGFTGVTTPDTAALVPSRLLEGVEFIDAFESTVRTVRALEPHVDAIVVLAHLGFEQAELIGLMPRGEPPAMMNQNDSALVPHLKGTKVVAILGGHTHDALEPARLIGGIAVCNAGAYGVKVGEARLELGSDGAVNVRTRLLDQDDSVAEDASLVAARERERLAFASAANESVRVPEIESGPLRQYRLLAQALKSSGKVSASSIMLVPRLYLLGDLPEFDSLRQVDVRVAYPSIESLVELTVGGAALKGLLGMQDKLMFFAAAAPLVLEDGREIRPTDLEDGANYTVVTSELIAEGGLFWKALPKAAIAVRDLEVSCAELVWAYLTKQPVLVEAGA